MQALAPPLLERRPLPDEEPGRSPGKEPAPAPDSEPGPIPERDPSTGDPPMHDPKPGEQTDPDETGPGTRKMRAA